MIVRLEEEQEEEGDMCTFLLESDSPYPKLLASLSFRLSVQPCCLAS